MIRIGRRFAPFVVALALLTVLSACSSGIESTGQQSGGGAQPAATGGAPANLTPEDARTFILSSMKGKKVVFFAYTGTGLSDKTWDKQFTSIFTNLGADYQMVVANQNAETMVRQMGSQIGQGADVFILQPPDPSVLSKQIAEAQSKGIYVIDLNLLSSSVPDAFIGVDYYSATYGLAERMAADCKAKGQTKVATLDGTGTDSTSLGFNAGWKPALSAAGMDVVSSQNSKFDPTTARQVASAVLQANPDLCGFIVAWDVPALGIAEAVNAAGLKGKIGIYSMEASGDWCNAVAAGDVTATVNTYLPAWSLAAAAMAQQLVEVGARPGSSRTLAYVPTLIVDKDNYKNVSGACYTGEG